jgi:Kef-type K+ transport system membrane component KefB
MLFLGVVLAITAVPVALKLLIDLGKLNTRVGKTIVSAAVIDDLLSLILLAILTSFIELGTFPEMLTLLLVIGKIFLFIILSVVFGRYVLPRANKLVFQYIRIEEIEISFLLIIALAFSLLAEMLGMHFIMGAFVAGLFFIERNIDPKVFKDVKTKIKGITTGFLAPIFFASIGLNMDISAVYEIPLIILLIIILALIGKLAGTMIPAYFGGFSKKEILAIGFSMNARGVVSIIIADIVLKTGLFHPPQGGSVILENLFSAVVIMAVITTLITLFALKRVFKS